MFLVDMNFVDLEKITPELTEQHKCYLAKQYEANTLMFGGRKVPRTGGILISMHDNEQQIKEVLASDPFVQSGAVTYAITEFVPVMASRDYAHLLV
ncbi:hypothetical protein N474_17395 [Pseudoalteromonas luteoviolacea CPMOR-2]|uniref:YciI family protein n=1 Tax=Pseudoalteromonas luteoviolacea TaxID=43657 RepID=UPI0007B07F00|nr:YciI family protein [Pseudoalteromonas luteoviolacea]KZN54684.1 hypothetical protein N474_17395 [Pseudoalteromonas luteoviolacea CPMOR-2]